MEALIRPEFGLMFWTILIFCLLLLVLSKTAWRPLIKSVEEREHAIKHARESADKARAEAEKIKAELDSRLAAFKTDIEARLEEAKALGIKERELILGQAIKTSATMLETARKEIDEQRQELSRELKDKVSELAFMAAEKVLLKTIDQKMNKDLVAQFLKEVETKDAKFKL